MKLENAFTVAAPIDRTWETLLDIERVAKCLPGATIEPGGEDGVYQGKMKVKLGPMTVDYRGTARFQDVDEDAKVASIAVQAREAKGQGTAAAVITNRLETVEDGQTKVTAETDLQVTGRQAQFGRGIMQDVAGSMMQQFATRLEHEIQSPQQAEPAGAGAEGKQPSAGGATGEQPSGAQGAAAPAGAEREDADEALDMGSVLAGSQLKTYGVPAAGGLLVLLLLIVLMRRRSSGNQLTLNVNLRR